MLSFLGDLGKELKNLITLMDQEEMQERQKEEQQNKNKESPVWFVITEHEKEESKIDQKPHIHAYHQNLLFHFLTPQQHTSLHKSLCQC